MKKKTLKKVWIMIFLYLFYLVFLEKEVLLESHSPDTDRHIEVIQYGTGILNWKTIRVVYMDGDEVVAKKPFSFLREVGSSMDASWANFEGSQVHWETEKVSISTTYSISFFGDTETRRMSFSYTSLQTKTTVTEDTY